MAFDSSRRNDRARRAAEPAPISDAEDFFPASSTPQEPTAALPREVQAPLPSRPAETAAAFLRTLHRELRMWVPVMSASLLTPADREPCVRLTYRQFGPCDLAWDQGGRRFIWTTGPQGGTSPGGPDDLAATVGSIARAMGATVRAM